MTTKKLTVTINEAAEPKFGPNDVLMDRLRQAVHGVVRGSVSDSWVKMAGGPEDVSEPSVVDEVCKRLEQVIAELKEKKEQA